MQNETLGSLFDLLKLSIKIVRENIWFLLLVYTVVAALFILEDIVHNIDEDSISAFFINIIANILHVSSPYFVAATLSISKNTQIQSQLNLLFHLYTSRFFKFFFSLVLKCIALTIGFILLLIPAIYINIRTYVMEFSAILDGYWPDEAFNVSSKITDGSKWEIFKYWGIITITFIVIIFAVLAIAFILKSLHTSIVSDLIIHTLTLLLVYIATTIMLTQSCLLYLKRR